VDERSRERLGAQDSRRRMSETRANVASLGEQVAQLRHAWEAARSSSLQQIERAQQAREAAESMRRVFSPE
jgi:hypothetical protein